MCVTRQFKGAPKQEKNKADEKRIASSNAPSELKVRQRESELSHKTAKQSKDNCGSNWLQSACSNQAVGCTI